MRTYGPFVVQPYIDTTVLGISANVIPVPIQVGAGGFIEVVNLSDYLIQVTLQSQGSVIQESNSKVLYRAVESLGTQMVQIIVSKQFMTQLNPGGSLLFNPPETQSASGQVHNFIFLNVYEAGEIEPYSPVSLQQMNPRRTSFQTVAAVTPFTLQVPDTFTVYSAPVSVCYCLGFDITFGVPPTVNTTGNLVVSNCANFDGGNNNMVYSISANVGQQFQPLIVRFPQPIEKVIDWDGTLGSHPLTFTMPTLNTTAALVVYYYLI